MKICDVPGCGWPVFSGGKCKYHQPKKPIRKVSKKRGKELREYSTTREEFLNELREITGGSIYCVFCNKKIDGEPDVHHTDGREESLLLDTEHWIPAHNDCHRDYHDRSWKDIPWWNTYMKNMKILQPDIYNKELIKMSK